MSWLFDVLMERLKTLFAADAAAQFEAQFVARQAERRAELLRRADDYEQQGHVGLAGELRAHAGRLVAPAFDPPSGSTNEAAPKALEPAKPAAPLPAAPQRVPRPSRKRR